MKTHKDTDTFSAGTDLEDAERAVLMLHGRGASAQSMLRVSLKLPDAAYLAPQAAERTWYPESFTAPRNENQPYLDSALEKVERTVEYIEKFVDRDRILIMGFSQGACLASEYLASKPRKYGGAAILSGGLIGSETEDFEGDMKSTPVYIGCSDSDPHIPLERVKDTASVFDSLNADIETYIFEGSHHGITSQEKETLSRMISDL